MPAMCSKNEQSSQTLLSYRFYEVHPIFIFYPSPPRGTCIQVPGEDIGDCIVNDVNITGIWSHGKLYTSSNSQLKNYSRLTKIDLLGGTR
jgi:hypothetical protein